LKRKWVLALGAGVGTALAAGLGGVAPARADGGLDAVIACLRKNAPKAALVQSVELISVDRAGQEVSRAAKLYAKRGADGLGRLLLRVEEPLDLRGTTLLVDQKPAGAEMYVFLPEIGKVRKVTAGQIRGRLLGSDFSYDELQRVFAQAGDVGVKRLPDGEKDGRAVYQLEATPPAAAGSSYTRVTSLVDRETCVPLEIAFYEKGDAPRKRITVDPARITQEGGVNVPRLVTIRDLEKGTESRLVTHEIEIDPDLSDSMFLPASLEMKKK
jgi:hypothetical protein